VHDSVDHGGDGAVAEVFTPITEGQVAGQDQGGVFASTGHELKEQVRCLGLEKGGSRPCPRSVVGSAAVGLVHCQGFLSGDCW